LEISALEVDPRGPTRAVALAVVCRAVGCLTGEEVRDGRLVLHVVGPISTLSTLAPLLARLAVELPEGSRSWTSGYAVGVAARVAEHVMIVDGTEEAVAAEFRERFKVLYEQGEEVLQPADYAAGQTAGQDFPLFQQALST
jgi:hypothetical protein